MSFAPALAGRRLGAGELRMALVFQCEFSSCGDATARLLTRQSRRQEMRILFGLSAPKILSFGKQRIGHLHVARFSARGQLLGARCRDRGFASYLRRDHRRVGEAGGEPGVLRRHTACVPGCSVRMSRCTEPGRRPSAALSSCGPRGAATCCTQGRLPAAGSSALRCLSANFRLAGRGTG